uniref:26S proteasome non-ATPase regulatory subunit 9 n=1 Tax=Riptortus pedestris TaxID=329032 RepID=R4WPN1_RIPPE|nr:26S proteasome non-ATPase regulatory subunit [Riptortus pedestris]
MNEMDETSDELMRNFNLRTELEKEISDLNEILIVNKNIGMTGNLVDDEGYPRNDIDVYQVKHARAKLIRLLNDYSALMKNCESLLTQYHASQKPEFLDKSGRPPTLSQEITKKLAIVGKVAKGSPSDSAGLKEGDIILEFGGINSSNWNSLQTINAEVEKSIDMYIKVIVERDSKLKRLNLKPKRWSGNGYLGCMLLPAS